MRLRLYENHRFVLYAPFYAAHAIGAYAAEGLAVELLPSPGMGPAEQALIDGAVDVIWAGPMRVMKHHDQNPGSALVCFAEIVCRDPFSIVGGRPNPDFRLADLAAMRFATVSEVPTPWLCLQEDLRQAGVDPERLDRIGDRSMADNLDVLEATAGSRLRSSSSPSSKRRWRPNWSPLVRGKLARPHHLYGFYHDTRPARHRRRASAAHGQGDLPDPAMDSRAIRAGDRGGDRVVFPVA